MSSTPPAAPGPDQQSGPPIPPGYRAGDYVPFKDRDPSNPSSVAGQWADPARQTQMTGQQAGVPLTPQQQYRAIYGVDAPDRVEYASWGRRVLGHVIDSFLGAVTGIPLFVGYWMIYSDIQVRTDIQGNQVIDDSTDISNAAIGMLIFGLVIAVAFGIWNVVFRQGATGYTLGKEAVGIRLVGISTGQPIGAGMSFVRQLAHVLDNLACYLGWLWPLWDPRNQTLADKVMGTVVVIQPADSTK
jgi:uncharacterized RDD family membrane protein YckC